MREKIKIAFLGGGINSAIGETHKIAVQMDDRYKLVAGCFSSQSKINQQTASKYRVDLNRTYDNLDDLIKNEQDNIDAICILTPIPNHKEEVIKCLDNKLPVICEKALASSFQEAKEIYQSLIKNKGYLAVIYNYTGYPMLRELQNLLTENKLGKIHQINIEMPQETYLKLSTNNTINKPQNWRLEEGIIPIIALDLGIHILDLVHFLINEKALEVVALANTFSLFDKITDNISAIIKYTNNIVVNVWFSKVSLGHTNGLKIQVYGEKSSAKWYQLEPENLYFCNNKGQRFIFDRASRGVKIANKLRYNRFKAGHPSGFIEAFANYYSDIADSLISNKTNPYVFGIKNSLEGLKILQAISKANKEKRWVKINEI